MRISSSDMDTIVLVGDACLFTAAAFCLLAVVGGPLALVIGPAAAWLLHDRRIDWAAAISEVVGIGIGIFVVGGFLLLVQLVTTAIGPIGGREFAGPVAFLATASAVFLALMLALVIESVRDLAPARRKHLRLDYARLLATLVVVVFVVVVSRLQWIKPESEIGDAGVFALGAAAVGAVTMLAMKTILAYREQRSGSAGK
jgi:hypothetical protein